jgi:hypothetical protein
MQAGSWAGDLELDHIDLSSNTATCIGPWASLFVHWQMGLKKYSDAAYYSFRSIIIAVDHLLRCLMNVSYKHAKYQFEIIYILELRKI